MSRGALLVGTGAALGLGAAYSLTRVMRNLLFAVAPDDPVTFAAVPVLLFVVALLACCIPVRRALRVDPVVALRAE